MTFQGVDYSRKTGGVVFGYWVNLDDEACHQEGGHLGMVGCIPFEWRRHPMFWLIGMHCGVRSVCPLTMLWCIRTTMSLKRRDALSSGGLSAIWGRVVAARLLCQFCTWVMNSKTLNIA